MPALATVGLAEATCTAQSPGLRLQAEGKDSADQAQHRRFPNLWQTQWSRQKRAVKRPLFPSASAPGPRPEPPPLRGPLLPVGENPPQELFFPRPRCAGWYQTLLQGKGRGRRGQAGWEASPCGQAPCPHPAAFAPRTPALTTHRCVCPLLGHLRLHTPYSKLARGPEGGEESQPPPPHTMLSALTRSPPYKLGAGSAKSNCWKPASQGLVTGGARSLPPRAGAVRLTTGPSKTAPPSKMSTPCPPQAQEPSPRPEPGKGQMTVQAPEGLSTGPIRVPGLQG